LFIVCLSWKAEAQTLTYQFVDPCTKAITYFSVPATGTIVYFYGQSRSFVADDVANGTFGAWINQVYADYRKISPCGQQQGQVTQNQITSQIIGNTVQSVVGSIMSQAQSAASSTISNVATSASTSNSSSAGGSDAASKNNKDGDKKNNDKNGESNSTSNTTNGSGSSNNSSTGVPVSSSSSGNSSVPATGTDTKTEAKVEEVAATTTMNVDQQNQNSSKDDNGGGGGGSSGGKGGKNNSKSGTTNPLIISSDFTTAQNLDKSFTPILNLSMSKSSMTGASSFGLTSMIWFNFKQFALSAKYTKINFSKNGKLKWVNNISLTSVYSYGNIIGFVGYSGILNAGKWGVTGFNTSGAMTLITGEQKNTFISPSLTAFYTKPFTTGKKLTISPELYIISTPLIYSTKEKVTTTDRTFSAFIGSGFDYQISRRFKINMNYKANMSTNKDFPILSFFLIGSKINL
jgi:hypothetical protein